MRPRIKRAMIRAQIKREQGVPVTNKNTEYKFSPRKRMKMEHAKRFFGITDPWLASGLIVLISVAFDFRLIIILSQ